MPVSRTLIVRAGLSSPRARGRERRAKQVPLRSPAWFALHNPAPRPGSGLRNAPALHRIQGDAPSFTPVDIHCCASEGWPLPDVAAQKEESHERSDAAARTGRAASARAAAGDGVGYAARGRRYSRSVVLEDGQFSTTGPAAPVVGEPCAQSGRGSHRVSYHSPDQIEHPLRSPAPAASQAS